MSAIASEEQWWWWCWTIPAIIAKPACLWGGAEKWLHFILIWAVLHLLQLSWKFVTWWICCVIDFVVLLIWCVCVVVCCFGNYLCNWFADIWCVAFYVIEFNFLFRCYRVDVLLWCAVDLLCKDLFYGWFVAKHWFVVFFDLLCWFFDALLVWCVTQMCHWFAVWRFVVSLIPCVIALLCSWKTVIVVGCLCGWFGDTWCDSLLCP